MRCLSARRPLWRSGPRADADSGRSPRRPAPPPPATPTPPAPPPTRWRGRRASGPPNQNPAPAAHPTPHAVPPAAVPAPQPTPAGPATPRPGPRPNPEPSPTGSSRPTQLRRPLPGCPRADSRPPATPPPRPRHPHPADPEPSPSQSPRQSPRITTRRIHKASSLERNKNTRQNSLVVLAEFSSSLLVNTPQHQSLIVAVNRRRRLVASRHPSAHGTSRPPARQDRAARAPSRPEIRLAGGARPTGPTLTTWGWIPPTNAAPCPGPGLHRCPDPNHRAAAQTIST
jgi:hypothetical protein